MHAGGVTDADLVGGAEVVADSGALGRLPGPEFTVGPCRGVAWQRLVRQVVVGEHVCITHRASVVFGQVEVVERQDLLVRWQCCNSLRWVPVTVSGPAAAQSRRTCCPRHTSTAHAVVWTKQGTGAFAPRVRQ